MAKRKAKMLRETMQRERVMWIDAVVYGCLKCPLAHWVIINVSGTDQRRGTFCLLKAPLRRKKSLHD